MTSDPNRTKMTARHLLSQVPLTRALQPRDLIELSATYADFMDHPALTGPIVRMGANQLVSSLAAERGIH